MLSFFFEEVCGLRSLPFFTLARLSLRPLEDSGAELSEC